MTWWLQRRRRIDLSATGKLPIANGGLGSSRVGGQRLHPPAALPGQQAEEALKCYLNSGRSEPSVSAKTERLLDPHESCRGSRKRISEHPAQ
jgi:hypothetical protein